MKKVFMTLAVVAVLCMLSSCVKNCQCKDWSDGVVTRTYTDETFSGDKCSNMTDIQTVGGHKSGKECS